MRITCPNCDAAYEVPEALMTGAARPVRCARCATVWRPAETAPPPLPPALAAAPPADVADASINFAPATAHPGLGPVPRPPLVAEGPPALRRARDGRRSAGLALFAGWVLSLAFLAALVWSGWHWRAAVMEAWPPSIRLYAAIGLDRP
jgi:predicted Zn finger-like uncharacterized protein